VITDGSANVLSNNLYDAFGVLMYSSGSPATQWRFEGRFVEEEGLAASAGGGGDVLVARGVGMASRPAPQSYDPCAAALTVCLAKVRGDNIACMAVCAGIEAAGLVACAAIPWPAWQYKLACVAAALAALLLCVGICHASDGLGNDECHWADKACESRRHHG